MKFLAFIMAFLVLALSVMPCGDKENVNNGENKKNEVTAKHEQDDQHHYECSPFCYCTCCAGFTINYSITSVTRLQFFLDDIITNNFFPSSGIEVAFTIWQPPRYC